MTEPLLRTVDLSKHFGGIVATDNVSVDIRPGEVHAVIGPNGAGKTTLIAQLTGLLPSDEGQVLFNGQDITRLSPHRRALLGLARSFQITSIFGDLSVLSNVALAIQAHAGHSFRFWRPAEQDRKLTEPALDALRTVGLEARAHELAAEISHGEQRQLEIAMALATRPKLLLLDEPMAGMGAEEANTMLATLQQLKSATTMLLVEHDMDVVFQLADRISVLVYGAIIATGTPENIRADERVQRAYLGEEHETEASDA
ncbi:MAG: ABC transporter ATP-binding protein [Pseudomonadota bacterium]